MKKTDAIKFYPKKYYEEMKNNNSKVINIEVARKYIDEYSKNSESIIFKSYEYSKKYQRLYLKVSISEKDLISFEKDCIEYEEVLKKCYKYIISFCIIAKKSEESIEKIKEKFNSDSANMEKTITSKEVKSYIDKLKELNENGHFTFSQIQI